jgi:hypothetical protein
MVDHETCTVHDPGLITVNGHRARIFRNITRREETLQCSCGWVSPDTRAWRWSHLIARDWRGHAGDIATGSQVVHGEPGMGCGCVRCAMADRAAAGDSLAAASLADIRAARGGAQ